MAQNREVWERIGAIERKIDILFKHLDLEPPADDDVGEVSDKVRKLAEAGDKAGAAKKYREETGTSLADAVAVVEKL